MTGTAPADFAEIVASWDVEAQCMWETKTNRCERPAEWFVNVHGCYGKPLCGMHRSTFATQCMPAFEVGRYGTCPKCGKVALSEAEYYTAVRL